MTVSDYPSIKYSVDYPQGELNKLTTFFRIFMVIPIGIILALIIGSSFAWKPSGSEFVIAGAGVLFLPVLLMIVFRQKYPRWWFDWILAVNRFSLRVATYLFLLRDEYPSTDEDQAVQLDIVYPDVKKDLSRWLPLVKWFLVIPHIIVLSFMSIAVIIVTVIAWFNILLKGIYPKGMFDFVVGVQRWVVRVSAYAFMLVTDKYPPFSVE